jgi:hypothetical protein
MKRLTAAIAIGIAAGMLSIPLALLPNVFNSVESSAFNQNLILTRFLGCSLQGLLAAGLLVVSWQKAHTSPTVHHVLQMWGLTALLGVAWHSQREVCGWALRVLCPPCRHSLHDVRVDLSGKIPS